MERLDLVFSTNSINVNISKYYFHVLAIHSFPLHIPIDGMSFQKIDPFLPMHFPKFHPSSGTAKTFKKRGAEVPFLTFQYI